ncbi:MAG: class I SAM-dependent DNA methyltransferase, partial [Desulfobulbia bacterium]
MGRLYDLILEDNPATNEADRHALNIFLSRLLFCFFAEDTGIFADGQFINALDSHTSQDGSDLQAYLQKFFKVLNSRERLNYPKFLQDFPYVNGGLFAYDYPVPRFSAKSRKIIIECGALNWKEINPDIFGSMMQAVVHNEQRSSMGMHYTSVTNIMKVIEPLFLNDLYAELRQAGNNEKKLRKLSDRLYHLCIFDPACGSGNFLIIAYKALCKLEIEIFKQLYGNQRSFRFTSKIRLTQFYGIELDDFAHETAKLSLWLAEHQMNLAFKEVFGEARPTLPLQEGGHIVCGNATRMNWENVCPKTKDSETYLLGNPPYVWSNDQSLGQREDMKIVLGGIKNYKYLDYVCCWFYKASRYIQSTSLKYAFVSTNSITQGQQVEIFWPSIYHMGNRIFFAYQPFRWGNSAKNNAGVTCIIVGICAKEAMKRKLLYTSTICRDVKNINAYLLPAKDIFIGKKNQPISKLPKMGYGNKAVDGGYLFLTPSEKDQLLYSYPQAKRLLRRVLGATEFLYNKERWCLWISNEDLEFANSIEPIRKRIGLVKSSRLASKDEGAQKLGARSHQFRDIKMPQTQTILVPSASSELRQYLPVGILDTNFVVTNRAHVIYDSEIFVFGLLSSRMHLIWTHATCGRLESRINYSSEICYNNFPIHDLTEKQKTTIESHAFKILDERECHSEKTMAQLYDPDMMPEALRHAHHEMDLAVEQCYRSRP